MRGYQIVSHIRQESLAHSTGISRTFDRNLSHIRQESLAHSCPRALILKACRAAKAFKDIKFIKRETGLKLENRDAFPIKSNGFKSELTSPNLSERFWHTPVLILSSFDAKRLQVLNSNAMNHLYLTSQDMGTAYLSKL